MCGIAAVLTDSDSMSDRIQRMTRSIIHRGADSQGLACLSNSTVCSFPLDMANRLPRSKVFLGHTRLSIIDTSSAGFQPMVTADGLYSISYNGEIYNYLEIKSELERQGRKFTSSSDTEVLLQAYIVWGDDCVSRFNGVWSFAILDIQEHRLVVSRDRLGVKPLYIYHDSCQLLIASEIKSILAGLDHRPKPNSAAISDYLNLALVDHTNKTFYQSIQTFPAGYITAYCLDSRKILSSRQFWSINKPRSCLDHLTIAEAGKSFYDIFSDSVSLRLRSDVPVGASLSGGIDSSAVVCMIRRLLGSDNVPLHTFTCVPEERAISEEKWSDIVSISVKSIRHNVLAPKDIDYGSLIIDLLSVQDQPFTTTSIYAQYLLMQNAARQGIRVILDGQGADEAFAGYRKYVVARAFELLKQQSPLRLVIHLLATALYGDTSIYSFSSARRYLPNSLGFKPANSKPCLLPGLLDTTLTKVISSGDIRDIQSRDITSTSLPSLLRYNDHNSMSCGVESRNPFLDYRLVELGLQLPSKFKISNGRTKAILRHSFAELIPRQVLNRRNKMGFSFGQQSIMKTHLSSQIEVALSPTSQASRYINSKTLNAIKEIWENGQPASPNIYSLIFRIYVLNSWLALNYTVA